MSSAESRRSCRSRLTRDLPRCRITITSDDNRRVTAQVSSQDMVRQIFGRGAALCFRDKRPLDMAWRKQAMEVLQRPAKRAKFTITGDEVTKHEAL